ncbi:MAG: HEPN domain-containing protein [Chloroflexi bacterium]|nr:HEPN domain-containing protein [Chloroflexota bacterium]
MKAYLQKSRNALKSMDLNAQASIVEWALSASYYAKYFAVYSLFSKIGVKCEIHDCTIVLFEYLFSDSLPEEIIRDLRGSKENRVEAQYYTWEIRADLEEVTNKTKQFVLEIEKVIDTLNTEQLLEFQKKLKKLAHE